MVLEIQATIAKTLCRLIFRICDRLKKTKIWRLQENPNLQHHKFLIFDRTKAI